MTLVGFVHKLWGNYFNLFYLCLCLMLLLSACSNVPNAINSRENSVQSLDSIPQHWRIKGRISMVKEQQSWYARFNWLQQQKDFQIRFTGPLGETLLQLTQQDHSVRMKTPSGETRSEDIEQLLFQQTGWELPIKSLKFWLQGFPNPEISARIHYDKKQYIREFYQAGWHIEYPKRHALLSPLGTNLLLPKKIIAHKEDVKIKLIISHWDFKQVLLMPIE